MDIDRYIPHILSVVGSAFQRKTAAAYRERQELGFSDWRVIAMLNIEPDITAKRVCDVICMNKAAVSRTLNNLLKLGLVTFEAKISDPKKRNWRLSKSGEQIHSEFIEIALAYEAKMMSEIDKSDQETFLRVAKKMLANIER